MNKACLAFAGSLLLAVSPALADESLFDSLARSAGLMAPRPDPPDFVKASRPKSEPTSIPVFATPEEPRSKVKTSAELKSMDADLERASRSQAGGKGSASKPSDAKSR